MKLNIVLLYLLLSIVAANAAVIESFSSLDRDSGYNYSKYGPALAEDSYRVSITPDESLVNIEWDLVEHILRNDYERDYDIVLQTQDGGWYQLVLEGIKIRAVDVVSGEESLLVTSLNIVDVGRHSSFTVQFYPLSSSERAVNQNQSLGDAIDLREDREDYDVSNIFRPDTPWAMISEICYDLGLGEREAALMGAVYYAEGGSFGCFKPTLFEDAEELAYTLRNNIDRFHDYLASISSDSQEAEKFGAALIATISLQYFRSNMEIAQSFLGVLTPGYLEELNKPGEPIVSKIPERLNYIDFLLSFISNSWDSALSKDSAVNSESVFILCREIASDFIDNYGNKSREEQFLFFSSFVMPYAGLRFSGFCPAYDLISGWGGIFVDPHSEQGFKLNTNWGMNTYDILKDYFSDRSSLNMYLPNESYFGI